jgi:hypothetical protein
VAVCLVVGVIQKLDGTPVVEAQVRASVRSTEKDQSGQIVGSSGVSSEPVVEFTDDTGTFSLLLLQGAVVQLEIPAIHLERCIEVPLVPGPVDFSTLV